MTILEEGHGALAELFARIPTDEAYARRETIGGGGWSAKDLAAHMGVWEELSLEVLDATSRGERPAAEDWFTGPGGADRLNDEHVRKFLDVAPDEIRARFEDLHRRIVAAIASTADEAWAAPYPFDDEDDTLGDRIGGLLGSDDGPFRHAWAHLPDLRAYLEAT